MVEHDKKSTNAHHQAAFAAKSDTPATIYFYRREDPYFELTNFSDHPIDCLGVVYATSEAAFQAAKFPEHPKIMRNIQQTTTASDALRLATELAMYKRKDWFDVNVEIMQAVVDLKLAQHPGVAELLKSTGDAVLVEDSPTDCFWGCGADRSGRNELGKILMKSRARLQTAQGDVVRGALDLTRVLHV